MNQTSPWSATNARRLGLSPDIDGRPGPIGAGRAQLVVLYPEVLPLDGHALAAYQAIDDGDPLPAVGVSRVVLGKGQTRSLKLGSVPGVHKVEREAPFADVLDLERHLRQHDRVDESGLDRGDDLNPACQG